MVANVIVVDALVSLPLTKTIRGTSSLNLFEKDKIRIKALQAHSHFHGSSRELGEPIINEVSNYRASFSGTEYLDTVTIGPLVITNQSIGVASNITGFSGVDGILG
ncbi:hypothetical protein EIP86_006272 [Pleurotus ostreatoroseus]|nr:hypothetical protein EIP86_006272 [Pleurotus ostreatoroseus]